MSEDDLADASNPVAVHTESISRRLMLTFMLLLVGAMAVASITILGFRISDLKQRLIAETVVRAETVATQVAASVAFGEPSEAEAIAVQLSDDPSIRSVAIDRAGSGPFVVIGNLDRPSEFAIYEQYYMDSSSLWASVPVKADGQVIGKLTLRADLGELHGEIRRSILTAVVVNVAALVLTLLFLLRAVKVIVRPITSLAKTADQIAIEKDYTIRAEKFADDEIGGLADRFNNMLETINGQSEKIEEQHCRLARSDRLESLGLLAGGVAHDLNNILGPMVAMPELIIKDLPEDHSARSELMMMSKAARRAGVVIQDLLSLARRGTYKREPVDINELIRDCLESQAVAIRLDDAPGVAYEMDLCEDLFPANASEPHLAQVLLNLVINAVEAMGQSVDQGILTISSENVALHGPLQAYEDIPAGSYVMISVKDQGPGLSSEAKKRIFEPFFTSKKMGMSGSGLGLAVVYGVIHDHGGYLDVVSDPGKGAEFRLYLQRAERQVISSEPEIEQASVKSRVLVVDDYKSQRILTKLLLGTLGHTAELAEHGHAAIEMLERDNGYDLMICDMIMEEGFDGLDTIRKALQIKPNLPCIIATGFSETDRVSAALELGACACLNKPYTGKTLAKAVQRALSNELSLVA